MTPEKARLYPVTLDLAGRNVLLVGGGEVALRKAQVVIESACRLTVVARRLSPRFRDWLSGNPVLCYERDYRDGEGESFFLVISATDDPDLNRRVYEDASRAQRLVNVVDQPHLCNFHVPSVLRRGALQVAVSTGGGCPALARRLRLELEESISKRYEPLLQRLSAIRERYRKTLPTPQSRKTALGEVVDSEAVRRFLEGDETLLEEMMQALDVPATGEPASEEPG